MVLVETSDTEKASLIFRQNCREVVVDSPEQCTIAVHQKEYCVIMTPPYSACDGKSLSIATEGCTSCIGLGLSYVDSGTNRTRALLAHLDMVEGTMWIRIHSFIRLPSGISNPTVLYPP